ncbi:MAG: hypothetical protein ACFCBW_12035 [Candidatus Competibacterales bacterium]
MTSIALRCRATANLLVAWPPKTFAASLVLVALTSCTTPWVTSAVIAEFPRADLPLEESVATLRVDSWQKSSPGQCSSLTRRQRWHGRYRQGVLGQLLGSAAALMPAQSHGCPIFTKMPKMPHVPPWPA